MQALTVIPCEKLYSHRHVLVWLAIKLFDNCRCHPLKWVFLDMRLLHTTVSDFGYQHQICLLDFVYGNNCRDAESKKHSSTLKKNHSFPLTEIISCRETWEQNDGSVVLPHWGILTALFADPRTTIRGVVYTNITSTKLQPSTERKNYELLQEP